MRQEFRSVEKHASGNRNDMQCFYHADHAFGLSDYKSLLKDIRSTVKIVYKSFIHDDKLSGFSTYTNPDPAPISKSPTCIQLVHLVVANTNIS